MFDSDESNPYAGLFPQAEIADIAVAEGGVLDDVGFRKLLASVAPEDLPAESWDAAEMVASLAKAGFFPEPRAKGVPLPALAD